LYHHHCWPKEKPKEQEQGGKNIQEDLSLEADIDYRVCLQAVVTAAETILS
jgi:hypothetical protein